MKFRLLTVGKIRTAYIQQGVSDFEKRLRRYCSLEVQDVPAEEIPSYAKPKDLQAILHKEAQTLFKHLGERPFVALDPQGKTFSSEDFARQIARWQNDGLPDLAFVIGGPLGLDDELKKKARLKLSLSSMTFLHEMSALLFLEQLYRAHTILKNEPYHK